MHTWKDTPTKTIDVDSVPFAYRELGAGSDVPVVFLHHLTAVLDDWDPRVIDSIAAHHRVITFDNRGVGASGSAVPGTIERMADDAIAFIRALGLEKVDLVGFSLGGGVAQLIALKAPDLVRRMILAGTGPRGGGGIAKMRTTEGKHAATNYLARLQERDFDRDKKISTQARLAQLEAIVNGGKSAPGDLSQITVPVLVANGEDDLMVATSLSADMARRLPNAELKIYPRSGHGGIFQHHSSFVPDALRFFAD
ncbi:alpha/beta fold hydrolase [Nocardia sp. NPDC055002]